jgi:hypothetical protein
MRLELLRTRALLAPVGANFLPLLGAPSFDPLHLLSVAPSALNLRPPDLTTRLIVRGISIEKGMDYESECILTHL